jgi:hypothetical protein
MGNTEVVLELGNLCGIERFGMVTKIFRLGYGMVIVILRRCAIGFVRLD